MCGISGNFGAGGRIGNSRLIFGINDGNSGRCGGDGNSGIFGAERFISLSRFQMISKFSPIAGGVGRFGILGSSILSG